MNNSIFNLHSKKYCRFGNSKDNAKNIQKLTALFFKSTMLIYDMFFGVTFICSIQGFFFIERNLRITNKFNHQNYG